MPEKPIIYWLRRDLRLSDHPGLFEAAKSGSSVIPVFVRDALVDSLGAAPSLRLEKGLEAFAHLLEDKGSRLVLRSGPPLEVLRELIQTTGAEAVWWTRAYDPDSIERDQRVKSSLKEDGIDARSFPGHLLFEPWTVETKDGGYYKVYSPMWRAVKDREVADPLPEPSSLRSPEHWPESENLGDWGLSVAMKRGAEVVSTYIDAGQHAAEARLGAFMSSKVEGYKTNRDRPDIDATSNLSEYLSLGEISPRRIWHAGLRAKKQGKEGAEHFLKELVWREFAYHLLYHTPQIATRNWREKWDAFPWKDDERAKEIKAWKQGRTGMVFVDAAMREMYVTGRMHNRARMIVGSYLTKHMLTHWKVGLKWFEDCLIDWDPASNALGWQWVAGSGPDAAPYFRVFNPEKQLEQYDPDKKYRRRWIAEGQSSPPDTALSYFNAIPISWGMSADDTYPDPIVTAEEGRDKALSAYENRDF
ncbi:cryptochrome/photolyase family protein [Lutimaribacter marinistellae]|uniref:Cryptochrome/photolyase family protein n=1 Tax=Lutimaribacter marinistellae TaxID=1820329 RepID=A0ABV7TM12_9RHOB